MLSTGQVKDILKVNKNTVYKWIAQGILHPIRHEIGGRIYLEFDPSEVNQIETRLKRKREPGKTLLKSR